MKKKEILIDLVAKIIEKWRNNKSMTSHRIADKIIKSINMEEKSKVKVKTCHAKTDCYYRVSDSSFCIKPENCKYWK